MSCLAGRRGSRACAWPIGSGTRLGPWVVCWLGGGRVLAERAGSASTRVSRGVHLASSAPFSRQSSLGPLAAMIVGAGIHDRRLGGPLPEAGLPTLHPCALTGALRPGCAAGCGSGSLSDSPFASVVAATTVERCVSQVTGRRLCSADAQAFVQLPGIQLATFFQTCPVGFSLCPSMRPWSVSSRWRPIAMFRRGRSRCSSGRLCCPAPLRPLSGGTSSWPKICVGERRGSSERTSRSRTALVATLDARDRYTAGHSAAVAIYARDIAERLGLAGGAAAAGPPLRTRPRHRQDRAPAGSSREAWRADP